MKHLFEAKEVVKGTLGIKRWGVGEISTVGKNMKVIENID